MNIVLVFNGLGNQMSQYAFYLAKKEKVRFCKYAFFTNPGNAHYGFELERAFGIIYNPLINKLLIKIYYYCLTDNRGIIYRMLKSLVYFHHEAKNYDFSNNLLNLDTFGLNFFWGGWHSEKNFDCIAEQIKEKFIFKTENMPIESKKWDALISKTPNSVSIHVRRGDYVNIPNNSFYQFGGVATMEYYRSAITYMRNKIMNPTFFIFSDDIKWCKENLESKGVCYVDSNKGNNSFFDMYLISRCHHHINANSTFSWWGAWLGERNDSIIIVPEFFIRGIMTKDIYPDRWIKISDQGKVV